jgi:diacylglycerol kinase family enzyme
MHFIGVFNRGGGTFRTMDMDAFTALAVAVFAAHGDVLEARLVDGDDLTEELRRAAREGDVLLAGGGDGTISAAAAVAFETGVPLAVLPAGTMNLFARTIGMPLDLEAALEAIAAGEVSAVDIATANGRSFVHQFSVGIHAKLVKLRDQLDYRSRFGKIFASLRAAGGVALHPPNFHAEVRTARGFERRAVAGLSVSNNPLEGPLLHAEGLDAGVLAIYTVAPLTPWGVVRLAFGMLVGRWKLLPEVAQREVREVTLSFPRRRATAVAAIDGELVPLPKRVELQIHPHGLNVVMPPKPAIDAPDRAEIVVTP